MDHRDDASGRTISCGDCTMRSTFHCRDCVVTFVLRTDDEPIEPIELDADEEAAVVLLGRAGLVPRLRFQAAS